MIFYYFLGAASVIFAVEMGMLAHAVGRYRRAGRRLRDLSC